MSYKNANDGNLRDILHFSGGKMTVRPVSGLFTVWDLLLSLSKFQKEMSVNPRKISAYIDLAFCFVVLPLVLSIIPIEKMFASSTIFTVILVVYLYITYFIYRKTHIPRLLMRRKFLKAFIIVFLLLTVTMLLSHFPFTDDFLMRLPEGEFPRVSAHRMQRVWFLFLVVSGFSLSIDLTFELFRQVIARKEVEEAKDKAELSLYKAQINPHFLFNSLNTIYGMIVSRSENTEEAFIKFTDMLKYMYNNPTEDMISLDKELEYIGNYIDFQELRHNGHTRTEWTCRVSDGSAQIPPMLLITFVENAFKYGSSSSRDCTVRINAVVEDGRLVFETENQIMKRPPAGQNGIGIENCRNRLELLYPERYALDINDDGDMFKVRLTIEL